MHGRKRAVAVVACLLIGCGTADLPSAASSDGIPTATLASASAVASVDPASGSLASATANGVPPVAAQASSGGTALERSAIEALVQDDLARYLNVPAADIVVASAEERTWVEANLGCGGRDITGDSLWVAGYLITLQHGAETFPYHTDRAGNWVRCLPDGKRIGPISR